VADVYEYEVEVRDRASSPLDDIAKAAKRSETELKAASDAATRGGDSLHRMGEIAGDADTALSGIASAAGLVSPELEGMIRVVGDLSAGLEGMSRGSSVLGTLGVSVASLGTAAAIATPLIIAGGLAWKEYSDRAEAAAAASESLREHIDSLKGAAEALSDAVSRMELDVALSTGQFDKQGVAAAASVEKVMANADALVAVQQSQVDLARAQMQAARTDVERYEAQVKLNKELDNLRVVQERANAEVDKAISLQLYLAEHGGEGGTGTGGKGGSTPPMTTTASQAPVATASGPSLMEQLALENARAVYRDVYPTAAEPSDEALRTFMATGGPVSDLFLQGLPTGQTSIGQAVALTPGAGGDTKPTPSAEDVRQGFVEAAETISGAVSGIADVLTNGSFGGGWWGDLLNAFVSIGEKGADGIQQDLMRTEESMTNFFDELPDLLSQVIPDAIMRTAGEGGILAMFIDSFPELVSAIWDGFMQIFPNLSTQFVTSLLQAFGVDANAEDIGTGMRVGQGVATGGLSEVFRALSRGTSSGYSMGSEI